MSIFNIFRKNSINSKPKETNIFVSDLKYNDINIEIGYNIEQSKTHLLEDYNVLEKAGIEQLIRNQFIPWLKGEEFKHKDDNKIYEGINIYFISYTYMKIIDKYSPTGEENYFGKFEFCFESSSDYTSDMLESVAMEVYVLNGKVVKVSGYEV